MLKTYAYHKPSPEGLQTITGIRSAFSTLDRELRAAMPQSREASLALTKLEEAAMWAVKAVVINDPTSEVAL